MNSWLLFLLPTERLIFLFLNSHREERRLHLHFLCVHRASGSCWPALTRDTNCSEACRRTDTERPRCLRVGLLHGGSRLSWCKKSIPWFSTLSLLSKGVEDEETERETVDEILKNTSLRKQNSYVQVSGCFFLACLVGSPVDKISFSKETWTRQHPNKSCNNLKLTKWNYKQVI